MMKKTKYVCPQCGNTLPEKNVMPSGLFECDECKEAVEAKEVFVEEFNDQLKALLKELKKFTKDCRHDMHEPDEQGITAKIVGNHLDNACGEDVYSEEYVIILIKERAKFKINLATLIAFARQAGDD